MEEGILEVLLVNADGIKHTNLIGKPTYHALIQCGSEVRKSKTTSGYRHKAFWNEKFKFKLPFSEWASLTHLQISIMNAKHFKKNGGIFIGGLVAEGKEKGYIELHPSSYNVVIEDTTYEGEIKIGLKFTINKGRKEREEQEMQVAGTRHNQVLGNLLGVLNMSWWRVLCPFGRGCSQDDKRN